MASSGGGSGRGAGAASGGATANRPFQQGGITGRRNTARAIRAQGGGAAITAEEFQRATGVNPRTGRRTRRRG